MPVISTGIPDVPSSNAAAAGSAVHLVMCAVVVYACGARTTVAFLRKTNLTATQTNSNQLHAYCTSCILEWKPLLGC